MCDGLIIDTIPGGRYSMRGLTPVAKQCLVVLVFLFVGEFWKWHPWTGVCTKPGWHPQCKRDLIATLHTSHSYLLIALALLHIVESSPLLQNGNTLLTVDELGLKDVLQDTEEEEPSLPYALKEGRPKLVVLYTGVGKSTWIGHSTREHTPHCLHSSHYYGVWCSSHVCYTIGNTTYM